MNLESIYLYRDTGTDRMIGNKEADKLVKEDKRESFTNRNYWYQWLIAKLNLRSYLSRRTTVEITGKLQKE